MTMLLMSERKKVGRPSNADKFKAAMAHTSDAHLTDEQLLSLVNARFEEMHNSGMDVANGIIRGLIIAGAAGVGKTTTLQNLLSNVKEQRDADGLSFVFEFVSGTITPINLYMLAYRMRHKHCVLVFDDCDVFSNEASLDILKAILDTTDRRRVSWMSESKALKNGNGEDTSEVPRLFDFEGSVIFITNKNFQAEIEAGTKLSPHLAALESRCLYLDLKLHTVRAVVLWIRHVVTSKGVLQSKIGITAKQEMAVLNWVIDNKDKLRSLSIRTAEHAAKFLKSNSETWTTRAEMMLFK